MRVRSEITLTPGDVESILRRLLAKTGKVEVENLRVAFSQGMAEFGGNLTLKDVPGFAIRPGSPASVKIGLSLVDGAVEVSLESVAVKVAALWLFKMDFDGDWTRRKVISTLAEKLAGKPGIAVDSSRGTVRICVADILKNALAAKGVEAGWSVEALDVEEGRLALVLSAGISSMSL